MQKIDIYNHVLPPEYFELVKSHSKDAGIVKRMAGLRTNPPRLQISPAG